MFAEQMTEKRRERKAGREGERENGKRKQGRWREKVHIYHVPATCQACTRTFYHHRAVTALPLPKQVLEFTVYKAVIRNYNAVESWRPGILEVRSNQNRLF